MNDINDWGLAKVKGEKNFSASALTDFKTLINTTEQVAGDDE